jgi:8-oxo-dGTP pyrophosphatase MutT (NUDIX family)
MTPAIVRIVGKTIVRAAGGVITRPGPDGSELLLVHRARYDDWSLPKGKAERGESDEACALREVEEETCLVCELGEEVAVTSYLDARGRPKRVRYFAMTPRAGSDASPCNEVDAVRWVSPERAIEMLSYARDREIVARLAERSS